MTKQLYYFLNFTFGLPMTLIGLIVSLVFLITGHKPKRFAGSVYFELGHNWGGLSLGPFFICQEGCDEAIKTHEFGHSIQNCMFGPLMPFVVGIPSAVRYWYREFLICKGKTDLKPYYSIWFEAQATQFGIAYKSLWEKPNEGG